MDGPAGALGPVEAQPVAKSEARKATPRVEAAVVRRARAAVVMLDAGIRPRHSERRAGELQMSELLRRGMPVVFVIVSLSLLGGCSTPRRSLERFEYSRIVMGVEARIALFAEDEASALTAARAAFDRMAELDAVMSDYRSDSEAMKASEVAGTGPISVSDDLCRVLARARVISELSGGAFDVNIGPVVELWREARLEGRLPSAEELASGRGRAGWKGMTLRAEAQTLELERTGMRLDFGGIGKGFAADEAVAKMRELGVGRCLVDLGGDIALGDPPPRDGDGGVDGNGGWKVGVRSGLSREDQMILTMSNAGIATSGDAEQYVEIAGARYSHIVDPRTGLGLTNRVAATVIAADAATADALASAICVLGPIRGFALLEQFPGASAAVAHWTAGGVERFQSDGFPIQGR